jgi:spermidine synthase
VGGLAATLFLKIGIQNFAIAVGCSLLTVGIIVFPTRRSLGRARYAAGVVFVVLLAVLWASPALDHRMTRINHPTLVDTRDSPYGRLTITGDKDQFVVFENDAVAFETQSAVSEEIVHLAAIHVSSIDHVLILGGGLEGILSEILKHKPERVDYVELNPLLVSLADEHLPQSYRAPLRSQTVTVHVDDPRRFVKDAEQYDLILVGMPDPTSGQSNRFYTREFFEECAEKLQPGGVLALRLRSSENIWTQFVAYRNTSIYRALKSVFADVVVLPGVVNINIASNRPLVRDPIVLADAFKERSLDTRLVTPEYVHYMYTNDRFFEIADRLASTDIQPNTDIEPVCYKFSSMIWLSKFVPTLINRDLSGSKTWSAGGVAMNIVVILLVATVFALARRMVRFQRTLLVAVAGFVGMVVETTLILHYQVKSGVLFQDIGILLTAFMAGLAVGSVVVLRAAKGVGGGFMMQKNWGYGLLVGFAVLNIIFIGFLYSGLPSNLSAISLLLFLAGLLVAGVFAYASLMGIKDQKTVVSPLYAADLLGGCIGSLIASLLLIPFLGMAQPAALMVILSVVALLLI